MPKLSVQDPMGQARVFEWDADGLTIGRSTDAGLILDDSSASRLHARITRESGRYTVRDLNSGNGLYVNGERVMQQVLVNRDRIQVGRCELTFDDTGGPPAVRFSETDASNSAILVRRVEDAIGSAGVQVADGAGAATTEAELEALRKKARILTLMFQLGKTLSGAFSLEEVYRQVSRLLLEVCPADRVLILEREGTDEALRLAYRVEAGNIRSPRDQNRTVSRTVTRKVMTERVTLLSSNASLDPELQGRSVVLQQIRSVICAPLLARDEVQGVIYLDQGEVSAFTLEDLEVVNAVAAQTAIALENVHALKRLTREAEARAAYSRFLPAHVVEDLLQRPDSLKLGGANQIATVLFADVRGFTRLSGSLPPEDVVAMLNEYFGEMTEIIFEQGGTLDKYIGDGLMALFGAPYAGPDDAINAVRAAMAMQGRLELLREQFRSEGGHWNDLKIGIGVYTGLVTVGYVGSARRLDYTAIGDTVNMAARLESNAPPGAIYISQSTYEGLSGQFPCRPLQVKVKGKDEPLDCYQVLWE